MFSFSFCLENGLGKTPPMGWNSWNYFACDINEQVIRNTADILVNSGLAKLGYTYVNIDDCWQSERGADGKIVADPVAFPSGMKALADYIHSKGLKFGLYSDAGHQTCGGRPGSLGYETQDANTYAEWGVDYLKYDNCFNDGTSPKVRYPVMRDALKNSGRDIFFSMCEWGVESPATWASPVGNSWRTTADISDNWESFLEILDLQYGLEKHAGPGAWNDPDMLEVGNGGMSDREYEAHFALWALLKSPLLIGCDLVNMSDATRRLLSNTELIAINQDPLGKQGRRIQRNERPVPGYIEVYAGEVVDGVIIILFNRTQRTDQISATFRDAGWKLEGALVKDLISKHDYGYVVKSFTMDVKPHQAVVLKLTECKECKHTAMKFLS